MMKHLFLLLSALTLSVLGAAEIHLDPSENVPVRSAAFTTPDNEMPAFPCAFLLRFREKELEIAVTVSRPKNMPYRITGKGNDDPQIFAGETIEIMLSPEPESGVYYHFGINPAGAVYTAKKRDKSWGEKIQVKAVKPSERFWSAVLRIPYAELGTVFPVKGKHWRVNVGAAVVQTDGKLHTLNWNGATNYHDINEFGTLFFDDATPTVVDVWYAHAGRVIALVRPASDAEDVFCQVGERRFTGERRQQMMVFDFQLPESIASLHGRLKCRFVRADGSIVREVYAVCRENHAFALDGFYYTPSMKLNFTHDAGKADVRLLKDGKIVRELLATPEKGSFSLENLAVGDYTVEIVSGAWRSVRLVKLCPENFAPPAISDTAALSISDTLLKLDGTPLFLVGGSNYPDFPLPEYAAFNLGTAKYGMQKNAISFTPQPGIRRMISYPDPAHIVGNLLIDIRKSYLAHPDHRRSFARLSYEAQLPLHIKTANGKKYNLASQPLFSELYAALKKEFPDRLYSIHIDNLNLIPAFGSCCDILELTSWRASFAVDMMRFLAEDMHRAKLAAAKPVIFWLGGSLPSPDQRSAEMLRAAIYEAMLARMSGVVFHLGHGGIPASYGRLWSLVSGINAEVQSIYPDLAQGEDVPDFIREMPGDFRAVARRCGGRTHLVVFNLSECEAHFEAKTQKGTLAATLTPLEVKVFSWGAE